MGRHRTANTGVSIYQTEKHVVEKKKRKQSDISIFDHGYRSEHTEPSKSEAASSALAVARSQLQASTSHERDQQPQHHQAEKAEQLVPPTSAAAVAAAAYASAAMASVQQMFQPQQRTDAAVTPPSPRKRARASVGNANGNFAPSAPSAANPAAALPAALPAAANPATAVTPAPSTVPSAVAVQAMLANAAFAANYHLALTAAAAMRTGGWPLVGMAQQQQPGIPMRRTRSRSALNDAAGISGPGSSHLNPRSHTPHTLTGVTAASSSPAGGSGGSGGRGARGGRQTALSAPSSTRRGSRVLQMPSAAMAGMLMGAQVTHGTSTSTADSPDPSSGLLSSQEDANHRLPPSAAADGAPLKMLPVPLQNSISDIAEAFNLEDFNRRPLTHVASFGSGAPSFGSGAHSFGQEEIDAAAAAPSPASPSRGAQHASFVPSPLRMTRSRSSALSMHGDEPNAALPGGASNGGGGGAGAGTSGGGGMSDQSSFGALPLQPSLSLVAEGLEELEAQGSPAPSVGHSNSPARLVGSPLRRTRSRGMQRDMTVSDFFTAEFNA